MSDIFFNGIFRGVELAFPVWLVAHGIGYIARLTLETLGARDKRS